MVLVGGSGWRSGVVIASAVVALLPFLLELVTDSIGMRIDPAKLAGAVAAVVAALALVTLVRFPGGLGAALLPATRWLSGGPFVWRGRTRTSARQARSEPLPAPPPSAQLDPPLPPSPAEEIEEVVPPPPPRLPGRRGRHAFRRRSRR
jgi:hypothetical protein